MSEPVPDPHLTPVIRLAPAKLNLTLAVVGRREDGFHDLHSVFVPLALSDRLSLAPARASASEDSLHVTGLDAGPAADNLVLRAIAAARAAVGDGPGRPADPVARGPAGEAHPGRGGARWRFVGRGGRLRCCARGVGRRARARPPRARGGLDRLRRAVLPRRLPALVEGRGERLTPLKGVHGHPGILLVTPRVAVRTPDVFAVFDAIRGRGDGSIAMTSAHLAQELGNGLSATDLIARAGVLASANDLLPAAILVEPGLVTRSAGAGAHLDEAGRHDRLRPDALDALSFAGRGPGRGRGRRGRRRGRHRAVDRRRPAIDHRHDHPHRTRGADAMTRQAVSTNGAPAAIGPYSQGIVSGDLVFCSGQLGLDPSTGDLVEGGVEAQAERALRNLGAVLDAAGVGMGDIVKTTLFLASIDDFAAVNTVYAKFMPDPPPARSTFAVGALPKGGLVEIEAIARRS